MIKTFYDGFLQSYSMHPPLRKKIQNYEDMHQANLKMLLPREDEQYIPLLNIDNKYLNDFAFIEDINDFLNLQASLDTRYAYPLHQNLWNVFEQQQRFFERKLFYFNEDLCFGDPFNVFLPVRPNYPYVDLLNWHMLALKESGIFQLWMTQNFADMVMLKYAKMEDLSLRPAKMVYQFIEEFYYIWMLYIIFAVICIGVFVLELVIWKYKHPKYY